MPKWHCKLNEDDNTDGKYLLHCSYPINKAKLYKTVRPVLTNERVHEKELLKSFRNK